MKTSSNTGTWPQRPVPADADTIRAVHAAAAAAVPADTTVGLDISVDSLSQVPVLQGTVPSWGDVVNAGHAAATEWIRRSGRQSGDVVVDVEASDTPDAAVADADTFDYRYRPVSASFPQEVDAVVVGAGISGLATARTLMRRGLRVAVFEAGLRVAGMTTSWNNGMVHPGHDPKPGTHKAALNVAGNADWTGMADELGLRLDRHGSMIVALDENDLPRLDEMAKRARVNGVLGAALISGVSARAREPRLGSDVLAALWTPSTAVVDPVEACLAMVEDIRHHDGSIVLGAAVQGLLMENHRVVGVRVGERDVMAPIVVNAAGIQADRLAATSGSRRYSLHARRGTLVLFDPGSGDRHEISIGPIPGVSSKGGGMTARPDGLTTGGPTAVEQAGRVPLPPTPDEVEAITVLGTRLLPNFPVDTAVHIGSAVRAATYGEDFVIGAAPGVPGLVDIAGIQSPGVASAPAIAATVTAELAGLGRLPCRSRTFTTRVDRAAGTRGGVQR